MLPKVLKITRIHCGGGGFVYIPDIVFFMSLSFLCREKPSEPAFVCDAGSLNFDSPLRLSR